jgi:hypothetical protein
MDSTVLHTGINHKEMKNHLFMLKNDVVCRASIRSDQIPACFTHPLLGFPAVHADTVESLSGEKDCLRIHGFQK